MEPEHPASDGQLAFRFTSYLGNKTTHLTTSYEANPGVYIPGTSTGVAGSCGFLAGANLPKAGAACSTTGNTQARRYLNSINPTQGAYYATIGTLDDGGIANYNGLLSSVQRQSKLTSLIANYTYAHCLSEAETTELTGPSYLVPGNRRASYSNCDSDRRHVANVSLVLNMPRLQRHMEDLALGGWGLSTIFTARSGGYFTVTTGYDNSLSRHLRPDRDGHRKSLRSAHSDCKRLWIPYSDRLRNQLQYALRCLQHRAPADYPRPGLL